MKRANGSSRRGFTLVRSAKVQSAKANRSGFTLIETMIAASVALVVGVLLVGILVNNSGVFNKESSMVAQGLNINDAMREIETYSRQAVSVTNGYPEGSPTYTTGTTTLVLKIPAINSQGVINDIYDFIIFTKDSQNPKLLKEYIFPDDQSTRQEKNAVLTNLLSSVLFEYLDNNDVPVGLSSAVKIKTTINVSSKTGSVNQFKSATVVTSLRNI
jgi:type II secretory pathway pseudopilin PulG